MLQSWLTGSWDGVMGSFMVTGNMVVLKWSNGMYINGDHLNGDHLTIDQMVNGQMVKWSAIF